MISRFFPKLFYTQYLIFLFFQGILYKKSNKATFSKDWKKKYVTLCDDGRMAYHPSLNDYMSNVHGKYFFLTLYSQFFLVRQLFFWRFWVNYLSVDLLLFYEFPDYFLWTTGYMTILYTVLILINRNLCVEKIKINNWLKTVRKIIDGL